MLLEPIMQYILAELRRARFMRIDETPCKYRKRLGYVCVVRTDRVCMILALQGRGGKDVLPFVRVLLDKPVTVDGYSAYLYMFKTLQRCWAHILRDAEDVCISHRGILYYRELYHSLKLIFHRAKEVAARTAAAGGADMTTCRQFADEVRRLAARYGNLKFAGTLHAAADNLFTFLRYPGMPPANNGSERDMRDWVVPIREASHKFMTERGMRVFSMLQSFAATCSKLNLNVGKSFLKVLHDPAHNIIREGLGAVSAAPPMLPICGTPPACPRCGSDFIRYGSGHNQKGAERTYLCKGPKRHRFTFNPGFERRRYPNQVIARAVLLYAKIRSAREVADELKEDGKGPHHSTVSRWVRYMVWRVVAYLRRMGMGGG